MKSSASTSLLTLYLWASSLRGDLYLLPLSLILMSQIVEDILIIKHTTALSISDSK